MRSVVSGAVLTVVVVVVLVVAAAVVPEAQPVVAIAADERAA